MEPYESKMNSIIEEATNILAESSSRLKSDSLFRGNISGEDLAFGMRDSMLTKCKEAIETLSIDISEERKRRKEAESRVMELQSASRKLEEKLKQQGHQVAHLTSELESAENSNQMLEKECERLNEELKPMEARQSATMKQDNQHLREQWETGQMKLVEKEKELEDLAASVSSVRSQLGLLETENHELRLALEELKGKNDDLSHKCERLQTQSKISETMKGDLKRAQEDYYRYLEEEKDRAQKQQVSVMKKFEELETRLREKYAQKDLELKKEMSQTIDNIQRDLDVTSAEHLKTRDECHSLKEENRRLKDYLTSKQEEFEKWKAAKIDQIERLQKAIESKAQLSQTQEESAKKDRSELKQLCDRLHSDNSQLVTDLATVQEKVKRLEQKLTEERRQYEHLNKSTAEQQLILTQVNQELSAREEDASALRSREKELMAQIENLQSKHAQERQSLLKIQEEKIELMNTQHQRELEEELTRAKQDLDREQIKQQEELEARDAELRSKDEALQNKEEELRQVVQQRDDLANELNELDNRVQHLKAQHEEHSLKAKSTSQKSNEQLNDLSKALRAEREKTLTLERVNKDLQEKMFELDAKWKQESALFRRESERREEEISRMKRIYDGRQSNSSVEIRSKLDKLKDDLAEEVTYLKQWYENLRHVEPEQSEGGKKWLPRFLDGLNAVLYK